MSTAEMISSFSNKDMDAEDERSVHLRKLLATIQEIDYQPQVRIASPDDSINAITAVINYILTDSFNLSQEESIWVGYEIKKLLEPLKALIPQAYMTAVRYEIDNKEYSDKLFNRQWYSTNNNGERDLNKPAKQALLNDWVEVISEIILISYPSLNGEETAYIVGSIHNILNELGLTNNSKTTRHSDYLPTAIRYQLSKKN